MTSQATEHDPYAAALQAVAAKKELAPDAVGRLDAAVRRVGWTESKNDPSAVQGGGGPGRGLFQFETAQGSGAAGTAAKRLKAFEKAYGKVGLSKKDRKILMGDDPDFSLLSSSAQKAILVADWVMKTPGDEVGEMARGQRSIRDFWLDYHWAGNEQDRAAKAAQWEREMQDYQRLVGRVNT